MGVNKIGVFPWGYLFSFFCIVDMFLYIFFDLFDNKLIVSKRGALEAPPIHRPINFTTNNPKYV